MKKAKRLPVLNDRAGIFKLLLIMKFTIALLFIASLHVSAKTYSQDRITLKLQAAELKTALRQIEKKSEYRFLYNDNVVSAHQKVNIDVNNALVTEVLDGILINTTLTYKVLDNNLVVITQKDFEVQETRVKGKVTGSDGQAVQSVTVRIKGSSVATSTDVNGGYSISVPDGATLVFSSVGFVTQEVKVAGRAEINVTLQISAKDVNEVVVIGYGSASKRDLTGSIVKISGKEIADKPNTNPVASLQGKVAGLSVVNNGTPGAAPDIRIRGTVSIGQVHPLYVVDGIFNDNIDYLNPNDIESIEVLKDPSSLAIFGIRGATGVIAISTKKAKTGQVTVNFNTSYGTKKLVDKIKMVTSGEEFKTLFAEENANNGITDQFDYTGLTGNTDWIDAVTRVGHFNTNNLSVSSSTDRNRFTLGLGYTADEGIIRHEKLERMLLSFGDELKISKALKVGINFNASRQNNPYDAGHFLDDARKTAPVFSSATKNFRLKDPYSADTLDFNIYSRLNTALQSDGVINPLLQLENEWNKTINIEYRTVGSVYAEVNFLKNFSFKSTFYADMSNVNKRVYVPLYYAYNPATGAVDVDNAGKGLLYSSNTKVTEDDYTYRKFQQDYIINYKKSFGNHNVTALAGFTTNYSGAFQRTGITSQAQGPTSVPIPDDPRLWYINNGIGIRTTAPTPSKQSDYTTVSYLARLLYNYAGKYYINASFRDDASSRIPTKYRHQKFWAVGAAWELSKENFMSSITAINFLKLKGSIGVLGNQSAYRIDGSSLDNPFYPNLNTGLSAVFGDNIFPAADIEYIPNPDLRWENVAAQEIGFELNAFGNKLHFEANYFNKTTKNLMTYIDRSPIGLKNKLINGGSIKNYGEEFSASWNQNINRDFSINIGGNITFLQNKVLSLSDELPNGYLERAFFNNGAARSRTEPGMPIAFFYGFKAAGVFQSYADVLKSPVQSALGAYGPGDLKYEDVNGDGIVDFKDRTMIGNPTPKFTYGTSITLNYKGFNLGLDLGGVYGNQVWKTWGALESPFQKVNYPAEKLNRWHGEGTSNWVPILSLGHRSNYWGSTYSIEDGSYFRIRNLQLGYNFTQGLISKAKIKSARLFVNIQNLKTWKNNSGYTAEFGGDATAFGYDNAGGAIPVVSTIGLNVTF
jgi:TonB-linked SusC/RagA family outer membrane protein